jgi:hypothetical protein
MYDGATMKRTRAELLWVFQLYLDKCQVMDPERRDRLSSMFLERQLSRPTERDFFTWQKTNRLTPATVIARTRGSRLFHFVTWLDCNRPFASAEERQRLTRLYNARALSREIEREFHQFLRSKIFMAILPAKPIEKFLAGDGTGASTTDIRSRSTTDIGYLGAVDPIAEQLAGSQSSDIGPTCRSTPPG